MERDADYLKITSYNSNNLFPILMDPLIAQLSSQKLNLIFKMCMWSNSLRNASK